jgi:hypothetical protein
MSGELDVLQEACEHGSYQVTTTDFDIYRPRRRIVIGAFWHECCTFCGRTTTSCQHLVNEWNEEGTELHCIVCGHDGT